MGEKLFGRIILLLSIFIMGCSSPSRDYARAKRIDEIWAYHKFLNKHSTNEYSTLVKQRVKELELREEEEKLREAKEDAEAARISAENWPEDWPKLRKGMNFKEVDAVFPGMLIHHPDSYNQLAGGNHTIVSRRAKLIFKEGHLVSWSANK